MSTGGWRAATGREARFLVGADGPSSRVARDCALGRNARFLFGAEIEIAGATLREPERLHCFLDATRARGYLGWAFAGVGIVQAGLACTRAAESPLPDVDAFVQAIAPRIALHGGTVVAKRAGLIPVGGPVAPRAADRVLLVGDAAGLVSPLTAGGIHTALASGRRAGEAIAAALANDERRHARRRSGRAGVHGQALDARGVRPRAERPDVRRRDRERGVRRAGAARVLPRAPLGATPALFSRGSAPPPSSTRRAARRGCRNATVYTERPVVRTTLRPSEYSDVGTISVFTASGLSGRDGGGR